MQKTVIVTGASRGIGLGIAGEFSSLGYNVVLLSRHFDEVRRAAKKYPGVKLRKYYLSSVISVMRSRCWKCLHVSMRPAAASISW